MAQQPIQKRNDGSQLTQAEVTEKQIILTRVFDASPEVVWQAWTDPNIVTQWWGPAGFTTTNKIMDVRPGGTWEHTMHGPDGTDYPNKKTYKKVEKPRLLEYSHGPNQEIHVVVNFESLGDKTKLTMTMNMPSAEFLQHLVKNVGAVEGAKQTLGRLAEHLESRKPSGKQPIKEVNFDRVYDAGIAQVWKAWTECHELKEWWGPNGVSIPQCEVDLRVGGKFYIVMEAGEAMGPFKGTKWPMLAHFTVVDPHVRLSYTAKAWTEGKNDNEETQIETDTDIMFSAEGTKTRVRLRSAINKVGPGAKMAVEGMQYGFTQQLDKLTAFLTK